MNIFDTDFQKQVAALFVRDAVFAKSNALKVSSNHFDDAYVAGVVTELRSFIEEFHEAPSVATLKQMCANRAKAGKEKPEKYLAVIDSMCAVPTADLEFTRQYVDSYIKVQSVRHALIKSAGYLSDFTMLNKIREEIEEAFKVGLEGDDELFFDVTKNIHEALTYQDESGIVIPTGIEELDKVINGGLRECEVGVVAAASGGGKSAILSMFTNNALREFKNTMLYSLEMQTYRIARRMGANMSGVELSELKENIKEVQGIYSIYEQAGGFIGIKSFPRKEASVFDLRDNAERIKLLHGIKLDLVVIDYAGEIKPVRDVSKAWEGEGEIYSSICAWAQRSKIPIWTATQINRAGMSKKTPSVYDVAGDISKIFVADVVLIVCQTEKEKKQDMLRLFLAKNRDGKGGIVLTCQADWARQQVKVVNKQDDVDPNSVAFGD